MTRERKIILWIFLGSLVVSLVAGCWPGASSLDRTIAVVFGMVAGRALWEFVKGGR